MTNTTVPEEQSFVAIINQLTEQVPETGFDGLSDLLLLLNEAFSEPPQSDSCEPVISIEKVDTIKHFVAAANAHLNKAPEQKTVDTLISSIKFFADDLLLDDEDMLLIRESLLQDQSTDNMESSELNCHTLREQLKLSLQQAENQELNGILDIIYLLDEWLEENARNSNLPVAAVSTYSDIVLVIQTYLSGSGDQQTTINTLINSLAGLDETLQLEEQDSALLKKLLLEEVALISPVQSDISAAQDQVVDQSGRIQDIQSDTGEYELSDYRQQLKLYVEQAEALELSGIQDILYIVNEWLEEHDEERGVPSSSVMACGSIVLATKAYLSAGGEQQDNIDTLLGSLGLLDKALQLEEEDNSLLTQLLLDEAVLIEPMQVMESGQETENAIESSATETIRDNQNFSDLKKYREQLKLSLQQAESLELSGILDIIYLLDEWLEEQGSDTQLLDSVESACGDAIAATVAYFSNEGDQESTVNTLIRSINSLDDKPLLEEEDSQLIKNLLLEEIVLLSKAPLVADQEIGIANEAQLSAEDEMIEIPDYLEEYVDILSIVFLPIKSSLDKFYTVVQNQQPIAVIDNATLENLKDDLAKFTLISETAEFIGLHQSSLHVQSNQPFLKNEDINIALEAVALFHEWSNAVIDYLSNPLAEESIHKILVINCSPLWPVVIDEERAANLLVELQSLDRRASKPEERQHVASEEDVSLVLPNDVSAVLVDSLLEELPEQTATFSAAIEHLSQGGSMDNVTVAQRVAHTLKGAGNTVNVRGIANITHHLEDILTALADENILPDASIIGTLHRASDCLEEMSESLTSNSPAPLDAVNVLQEILDIARRIDTEGITHIIKTNAAAIVETPDAPPVQVQQAMQVPVVEKNDEKESEQMIRFPVATVDKLLQFSDEMMINNGQLREQLKQAISETKLLQAHLEQFHYHSMELLGHVDMQRIHQIQNKVVSPGNDEFDSLEMDQYNELYSTSLRIHEMTSDSREMNRGFANQLRDIDAMLIEQGYLNGASQTSLLDMRTVAVQSIVPRLQRGVRQAARMSGKEIDLQISGQDLLVDKDILNSVLDPLMHLLRNAVGHGIENKADRVKAGKSEQGNIKLHFYRDKNMIAVDCIDDGGGLNLEVIKRKALKIGMISEDSEISDDELKQLIMQPNFSTQDEVNQIAGRGVGMDAVNSGIRALGGVLRLESETGKGCTFHIQLPLSLAHHNCLLINIGKQTLALSELGIEQVLLADSGILYPEGEDYWFIFDEQKYAVKPIESLLSRVSADKKVAMEARTFLLINQQEHYFAIAVESVKSVNEMIVKDLEDVLPHIHGVIGASVLNDGSIAPVLDLQELLQEPSRWGMHANEQFAEDSPIDQTRVLVVDDSLSARRSLEQFFSDMGYQVMSARDGLDALDQLEKQRPDIIVTDLEMPRINGIELTENLRREGSTKELPIVMITSRATAKHKAMAEEKGVSAYLTKPYSEDELSTTVLELLVNQ